MIERAEAGKTRLIPEFPPIPKPKKITEGDIRIAVENVIKEAREQRLTLTANAVLASADWTTLSRLRSLVPEKARTSLELSIKTAKKGAKEVTLAFATFSFLIASGCGNVENPNADSLSPKEPTPVYASIPELTQTPTLILTTVPRPTEAPKLPEPEYEYLKFDNIKVAIDKDGLPVKYILPDGREVLLDKEKVLKAKESAISSEEPEIIEVIPLPISRESQYKPSVEHPKTSELPKDVLSEDKLKAKRVSIIPAKNTNLYITEGAFAEGGPLESFNKTGTGLTIVLIDGPVISPYFMSDPKYAEVKKKIA